MTERISCFMTRYIPRCNQNNKQIGSKSHQFEEEEEEEEEMYGKTISIIVLFAFLIASYSIYMGTIDPTPYFSQLGKPSPPCNTTTTRQPLRVFMYDLPRKFNLAMMHPNISDVEPITAENLPSWHQTSGVGRQHSVEYWLMASLLNNGSDEEEKEAVRVLDPELADAFYVPFFSSLSFNTHGKNMTDPDTELDRLLQVKGQIAMPFRQ